MELTVMEIKQAIDNFSDKEKEEIREWLNTLINEEQAEREREEVLKDEAGNIYD